MPYYEKEEIIRNVRITAVAARYSYVKKLGKEWVTICPWHQDTKPSLTINEDGTKCYCHVCHSGGSVISYYMQQTGVEFKDACEQLGNDNLLNAASKPLVIKDKPIKAAKWQACKPPKDAVPNFKHHEMGDPVGLWCYRDADGDPLFWETRYLRADADGVLKKEPRPLTWGSYSKNVPYRFAPAAWQAPRPIYGLDQIATKKPDSKIIVFEGPRKAELASSLLYNPCCAWGFGAGAWRHSDWSIAKGRHIILFPDHDTAGKKAMNELAQHLLSKAGAAIVEIVDTPDDKPNKWDICDEEGLTSEALKKYISNRRQVEMEHVDMAPPAGHKAKSNGKAGKFTFDASKLMNDDGVIGVIIADDPDEDGNLTGEPPEYADGYAPPPEDDYIHDPDYTGSPEFDADNEPPPEGSTEPPHSEPEPERESTYTHADDSLPEPEDLINTKITGQPFNPDWLPLGLGEFSRIQAKIIGSDIGAVAMSILATCAGAIDDRIKIYPNRHGHWAESARLWVALVGPASVSKSPPIKVATDYYNEMDTRQLERNAPAEKTQKQLIKKYSKKYDEWSDGDMTGPAPTPPAKIELNRYVFSNATVEGFRDLLSRNNIERGVLLLVDELSGWFGSFGQYKGGGGADRAEWIMAYQGGSYKIERAAQGTIIVNNWGASVLGGIQPDKIAEIANKTAEDGLLQRMWFVYLNEGMVSQIPTLEEAKTLNAMQAKYHSLLEHLVLVKHNGPVHMTDEAREITQALTNKIDDYCKLKVYGPKSISALKKLSGSMHRLCLVLHCLECHDKQMHPSSVPVSAKTANQACQIIHQYIMPSIKTFYNHVLGERGYQTDMERVARWLLEHDFAEINVSLLWNNCRGMRQDVGYRREILASLSDCGWLIAKTDKRDNLTGIPKHFKVNPRIYQKFSAETVEFRKEMNERKALMKQEGLRNL
jgi:5S rRNA maturation endonuclease (ribonuclease M5)